MAYAVSSLGFRGCEGGCDMHPWTRVVSWAIIGEEGVRVVARVCILHER